MKEPSQLFLEDVVHFAKREGVDPQTAQALQEELACHIDAAVQARLETGERPEEAVRNAVRAVGEPLYIVRGATDIKGGWRPVFMAMSAMLGAYMIAFDSPRDVALWAFLTALLVGMALLTVTTWRAKRVQWKAGLALVLPTWCALVLVLSAHYVTLYPGDSPELRSIDGGYATYQRSADSMQAQLRLHDKAYNRYLSIGNLMLPDSFDINANQLTFRRAKSATAARRYWDFYPRFRPELVRIAERETYRARAAFVAAHSPFWREAPHEVLPAAGFSLILVGFVFLVHLAVVFLRWFVTELDRTYRQVRRSRALKTATFRGGTRAR